MVVLLRMGRGAVITFSPKVGLPRKGSVAAVFGVGIPSAVATFLFDLDYVIIDKLMVSYHDLALAAVGIVLVSYTHLDVYKRQMCVNLHSKPKPHRKTGRETGRFGSVKTGRDCSCAQLENDAQHGLSLIHIFVQFIM